MKVCIHTVIKNELDEYLISWLDYHTKMVDHIFIFEDLHSHSHKHITDRYEKVTLMSVMDICKNRGLERNAERGGINQRFYITDGVLFIQSLKEYDWCFTLDIDEYITLQSPYKAITSVLSEFEDYDAVLLQWMNFGASQRIYKPDYQGRDYREFYTERGNDSEWDARVKANTKIGWNLNRITRWNLCGLHCCAGKWVKTNFKKDRKSICYDKMYLSHYITRSWEEYIWKRYIRGMHTGDRHRNDDDFFQINPDMLPLKEKLIEIKNNILKE